MARTSVGGEDSPLPVVADSSRASQVTSEKPSLLEPCPAENGTGNGVTAAATAAATAASHDDEHFGASMSMPRFIVLSTSLSLGFFLAVLDSSVVATSLYAIAIEFREIETINWVALAYTLAYLSCAVLFARISDVIGRRAAFVSAYVIFIGFSLGCGWSRTLNQLIAFRAIQGIGGSGLYSLSMILMPEVAPLRYQKFMIGFIGIVLAVSGVLGPLLGGLLTEYTTWRWVFWINGPIGGASVLVFYFAWPDPKQLPPFQHRKWKDVDFLGSFLLVAAAVLIVFPFQNSSAETGQWGQAIFLAPLLFGILCLVALSAWQLHIDRNWEGVAAAIPMVLVRNRAWSFTVLNTILVGFPYLLCLYVFPIRFQVVHGKNPFEAGLMLLPMLGTTALGSFLGGMMNGKKNIMAETLALGSAVMLIGCALETTAGDQAQVEPKVLGFEAFMGFGFGLSATASTMIAAFESPIREHASSQGIMAQIRILGGSIGIAASSAILGVKLSSELGGAVNPEQLAHSNAGMAALAPEQQAAVRKAYTEAFHQDMIVCCALLAVAVLLPLGVYRRKRVTVAEQQKNRHQIEAARIQASEGSTSDQAAEGGGKEVA